MSYKMSYKKKKKNSSDPIQGLTDSHKSRRRFILPLCIIIGVIAGIHISTISLFDISPDFYNRLVEESVSLPDAVLLDTQYSVEKEGRKITKIKLGESSSSRNKTAGGGMTAGGGDPRSTVVKKGVLGIISGSVNSNTTSEQSRSSTGPNEVAGIGFGSGFGGSSGDIDELFNSSDNNDAAKKKLKKRGRLKIRGAAAKTAGN